MSNDETVEDNLGMTADIVAAYVTRNPLKPDAVPELIRTIYQTLSNLGGTEAEAPREAQKPAVSIGRSIQPDYLVCLEDGKRLKMLKRYLRARYDMTPEDYRRKWGLPPDYPMVAPNYSQRRSEFAKEIGLGRGARKPAKAKR